MRAWIGVCAGIPSNLRVAVTTRPCSAACSLSQSISYRGVEVVGFTEEDVTLFALKYLGKESGRDLLLLLNKHPSIAGMMHTPLFCLLICDLFQEEQELPSRQTEIFEKIVVAVLRRYAKVKGLKAPFRDIAHAPARLLQLVLSLGKVAYQGLLEKQMYFTDVELDEDGVPEEALELGLLTKSESAKFWEQDEYTFSHLTIQEFLAALYVSSKALQTEVDMAKLLEKVSFLDGHLSTFWVFLAGVLHSKMVDVLLQSLWQAITARVYDYHEDDTIMLLMYRCFAESHLARSGLPSATVGKSLHARSLQLMGQVMMSTADCSAISTVLQIHPERKNVQWVGFFGSTLSDYGLAQLLPGLQLCTSLVEVELSRHDLSSQHMSALGSAFANSAGTLEDVYLFGNSIEDDGLEKLSHGLRQCQKLRKLQLWSTNLTWRSGAFLGNLVSCLGNLQQLHISENSLGDHGLEELAEGLQQCKTPPKPVPEFQWTDVEKRLDSGQGLTLPVRFGDPLPRKK